jgi:hypothetical protein
MVTLEHEPRVIRTLTADVSKEGCFVRMMRPLPEGTKVNISLEAGGRALSLAHGEVRWGRPHDASMPGRFSGCGVQFTEFTSPRGGELVNYLVKSLPRGRPLRLAPSPHRGLRLVMAALVVLAIAGASSWGWHTSSATPAVAHLEVAAPAPTVAADRVAEVAVAAEPLETLSEIPKLVRERGRVALPTEKPTSLRWVSEGEELRLEPEARRLHAFVLSNPPRAVFDLNVAPPRRTSEVAAAVKHVKRVRVGIRGDGVRVVVDLDAVPRQVALRRSALVLNF